MKNYSYITLLSDDSYIFGIILLQESLKRVNTQYPLEIIVTPNVSKPVLNILDQLKLKYRIVEAITNDKFLEHNVRVNVDFARTWSLTLTKYEIFRMTDFDKIVFVDADMYVLKNLDHLFDLPHRTAAVDGEYFNLWPDKPFFNAGLMIIEPNEDEYNQLIDYTNNYAVNTFDSKKSLADQELLNEFWSDWAEKEDLHLSKYYNIFAPYTQEEQVDDVKENGYCVHFIGRKPWRAFSKDPRETYSEKLYDETHNLIQELVNKLDWDRAKQEIKLAVYAICKDEKKNIRKYVECFNKADYLCILDTGSTDGTWEYLQNIKSKYPNLIIDQKIIDPWRYDTARNLSLELVPKDTTMYFMVDIDEIIKEKDWVATIKNAWNPLFLRCAYTYNRQVDPVSNAVIQQFVEYRIHNNSWHYKGIVHEQLCNVAGSRQFYADECIQAPIVVWHYPTNPNREVYIELCERGVAEEPLNWLMHLQLAAEYEVHKKYDKAIVEYRKIIAEQTTLSPPEVGRCYASLGRALVLTDQIDEGINVLEKGTKVVPSYGDCYFFAAEAYYNKKEFQKTFDLCNDGLTNCKINYWCTIVSCDSYFPFLLMGLAKFYLKDPMSALGYVTYARTKNNNEEVNNVFNQIIQQIDNRR